MNCYNHTGVPALGICKHCNKGICKSCITDLGDGIACTASCVEEVENVNRLVRKSGKSHKTAANSYSSAGVIMIIMGGFIISIPIIFNKKVEPFGLLMGSLIIAYGIWKLVIGLKYNKDEKPI